MEKTYTVTLTEEERKHLMRLLASDQREFQHELETVSDSVGVTRRFQERVTTDEFLRLRLSNAKPVKAQS